MDISADIDLLPSQYDFAFSESPNPAIIGGLGSGKTQAGISRLLYLMGRDKKANTLYAMPTYDLLNLRAIPGAEEELNKLGLPYDLNKSNYSIKVKGHGTIYFRSYDNPGRFIAFEVAHSIADEIDTLKKEKAEEVWRKITERTRQNNVLGMNSIGCVTTPDRGVHGFVYDRWERNKTVRQEIIKASTYDNPFLPTGYADQILENYDSTLADLYLKGEFVNLNSHTVYHFFDRKVHALTSKKREEKQLHKINSLSIGVDFNIGGCCASIWKHSGKEIYAIDEFVSHDTYDFVNQLNKYKGNQITVYPDASGHSRSTNASQTDIQIIVGAGYRVDAPQANPLIRDRINSVNSKLSKNELFIDIDKCQRLTEAIESQSYEDGEPEKFDKHPAIDDWADGMGYFISRKFPIIKTHSQLRTGGLI